MKYHLKGKYRLKVNTFLVKQFKIWCSLFLIIGSSSYILKNAYAATEEWDISKDGNRSVMAKYDDATTTLTISGTGTMKEIYENGTVPWYRYSNSITKVEIRDNVTATSLYGMFSDLTKLKTIENLDKIDTSYVTNMSYMFSNCKALTKVDLSNFDISNATNTAGMFNKCQALTELDVSNFDTSKVTNMASMFNNCQALTELDVSNFDTSHVTNMASMFYKCQALTELDVSNFNTDLTIDMNQMFFYCQALTELDVSNFNTSSVTNMFYMFSHCQALTKLDVSHFDTSKVTNMSSMFYRCQSLTKLDVTNFNTDKVTSMSSMFYRCQSLTKLDVTNFNTNKVTDMFSMFSNCQSLINVQGLDISNNKCYVDFIFINTPHLSQVHVKTKKQLEIPHIDSEHRWYNEDKILDDNNTGYATVIPTSDNYVTYTLKPTITHNIIYELDDGVLPDDAQDKFEILKEYELPIPTKSEYIFDGWYDSADFDKKMTKIEKYTLEDKTVYAKWIKKTELQANNFSVKLSSDTYTGDEITYTITSSLEGVGIPQVKKLEKDGIEINEVREAGTYKITFDVDEGEKYLGATGLTIVFTIENKPVVEPEDPIRPNDKPIPPVNKPTIPIENSTPPTDNSQKITNVETGDNSFIILYGGMVLVGLGVMIYLRRKENE